MKESKPPKIKKQSFFSFFFFGFVILLVLLHVVAVLKHTNHNFLYLTIKFTIFILFFLIQNKEINIRQLGVPQHQHLLLPVYKELRFPNTSPSFLDFFSPFLFVLIFLSFSFFFILRLIKEERNYGFIPIMDSKAEQAI